MLLRQIHGQFLQALTAAHCKGAQQMPSHAQDSAGAWMLTTHSDCLNKGTAELLCKVRLSTSSWHLAYGVGRQKSNMDAPGGCHKGHGKVLRHLTCSTCCCCGSSADEVKGYMQGHRGRAHSKVTTTNAVKCRGCGLFWNSSIMPKPSTTLVILW